MLNYENQKGFKMEKIEIEGSTVDFFKGKENELITYQFDTSECAPPEPMINAMIGLRLLDENSQLIMINHKSPIGLFPKIENNFEFKEEYLSDGRVKIIFRKKQIHNNK